jgi:DNA-binding transcriptional LysR family regulator
MARDNFNDILAFIAVARERSFTRAATKLGVSQSALSHTVRALEAQLGVRLLARTTRSVAPTEAGERLLQSVAPRLEEIESEIARISELGEKAVGLVRITAIDHVADAVVWPRVRPVLDAHPEVQIEISSDYRLVDIVAERFDIGIRYGDQVAKDMITVRLTDEVPMAIVGSPSYLASRPEPLVAQDLLQHNCITLRLSSGGLYAWELKTGNQETTVRVAGQSTFNGVYPMRAAALDGCGLAFLPLEMLEPYLRSGALRCVLPDCCPAFPPLYAYYPNRRHTSRAVALVIDALRNRPR